MYADSLLSTSSLPAGMFEQIRHLKTYNCTSRIFYCGDLRKRQVRKPPDELLEEIAQNSKTSKELRQAYAFHFQILSTFKGQDASVGGK